MKLSLEDISLLEKNWNPKSQSGSASMTFGGRIQFSGNPHQSLERLKALESLKSSPSKQALEDPQNEALPREVDAAAEDFVEVTYRALSAAILGDRPIDFTKEAMLKKGVRLLNGQTVFKDHETSVDNWVGQVIDTWWDSKTPGLPPGINAKFRLDMVKDPMAVRGVLQGAIHSASVTVSFQWEASHPKLMEENRFFQNLGEIVDGEMVRVVVTKIEKFWEISLVWQGADEFAKQIDEEGNPLNIYEKQDAESLEVQLESNNTKAEFLVNGLKQEETMSQKIKEMFKKMFGEEMTEENFEVLIKKFATQQSEAASAVEIKAHKDHIQELNTELKMSNEKVEELSQKISQLAPQAELGMAHLNSVRNEAVRLYKLSKGEQAKEVILKTLENANLEIALAWKEDFEKEVESKYPNQCQKCGSKEISRQSHKVEEVSATSETKAPVINEIQASKLRSLHG